MTERPLSRQPACGWCSHEHQYLPCEHDACSCPPHDPPGIYEAGTGRNT